ncbi:MAG: serine/threonine-protein kinase [Anaerolineae bacterium]
MTTLSEQTLRDTDSTATYIRNRQVLSAARVAWLVCFVLNIAIVVLHTPYFYSGLRDLTAPMPQRLLLDIVDNSALWRAGLAQLNLAPEVPALLLTVIFRIAELVCFSVSLLIFLYRSDNWMALWLSLAIALVGVGDGAYLVLYVLPAGNILFGLYSFSLIMTVISILFLLPDGHFFPASSKWLLLAYGLWEVFRHIQYTFQTELFNAVPFALWYLPLVMMFCGGVIAQVVRYRRTSAVGRHQIKWLIFGVAVYFVVYLTFFLRIILSDTVAANSSGAGFILFQTLMTAFIPLGLITLAICIGVAVMRYRLYDINVVIHRSLVYGSVTVLLAVVFLGVAFLLQSILGSEQSGIAVVGSVFVAGLLFNPVRSRAQRFIDRRFYGFRFDLNQVKRAQQLPEIKNPGALTGKTLGKYQVLGVVGRGGMGEVYQGWDGKQAVALKILTGDIAKREDLLKRFEREAETLATLNHPNIVKIYDAGYSGEVYYMAMELVEGRELAEILRQRGALPIDEITPFVSDVVAALNYAHHKGLVHRDIKPSNIMLRLKADKETEEVVLMDFGVAKIQDAATSITGTGAIGTIGYMAPEQIIAAKEVDQRADIYALGVVLYEMLTGERPFKGNPSQVLFAHLQQPAPNPRDVNPAVPAPVALAVMRALAKTPEERFQSVGELAAALRP